jgi:hypothetical protein
MNQIKLKTQGLSQRCEICHQTDLYDPKIDFCSRCAQLVGSELVHIDFPAFVSDVVRQQVVKSFALDERLIWIGKPKRKNYFSTESVALLFCAAYITFLFIGPLIEILQRGFAEPAMGVVFLFYLLVMLLMLAYPLKIYYEAKNTIYLLTNKRAIIIKPGLKTRIRTYGPEKLIKMQVTSNKDGVGDIAFVVMPYTKSRAKEGFIAIENVRLIESIIRDRVITGK